MKQTIMRVLSILTLLTLSFVAQANIRMTVNVFVLSPAPVSEATAHAIEAQLECLAINIYREAGGEPEEGKVGVAQVTMNRAAHPAFPKDICAVVHQKKVVHKHTVCQFSWYCTRHSPVDALNYYHCREIARRVMINGYRLDKFRGALFFHTVAVRPVWRTSFDMIGRTGHHLFYRPRGRRELMYASL